MFGRWLPRKQIFFDFFEQHAALGLEGVRQFVDLARPGANIVEQARRIKELEHETDVVTHRCVAALHRTFVTPIAREDIYRLITRMDDVIDDVEATAERIVIYELTPLRREVAEMADVLLRCALQVQQAVGALRNLKNADFILQTCIAINQLENEGDALLRRALARLFRDEKDPMLVIKYKEIFEYLESATDRCEDVAQILEGVVLEHA